MGPWIEIRRQAPGYLGRPSGRAERSALGGWAPARSICRSGRTPLCSRALAADPADPADPADQNRLTSPGRPAFLTATLQVCTTRQARAAHYSVRYGTWIPSCPDLGSCYHHNHQPPILRFAFLYLPFPHHLFLVLSCRFRSPSLTPSPRARACPAAASARRVWSKQGTLPPSLSVLVTSVNGCTCTCTCLAIDIRRYLSSTCSCRRGPISCRCLRLVLAFRHFITEGTSSHHRVPAARAGKKHHHRQHLTRARLPSSCWWPRLVSAALAISHYLNPHIHSPRSPPLNHCRRRRQPDTSRRILDSPFRPGAEFLALGFSHLDST